MLGSWPEAGEKLEITSDVISPMLVPVPPPWPCLRGPPPGPVPLLRLGWRWAGALESPACCLMEAKVQPPWKILWWFLRRLHMELPWDPAIPLPGTDSKELITALDTCLNTNVHRSTIHTTKASVRNE